jgi:hypothetical protein
MYICCAQEMNEDELMTSRYFSANYAIVVALLGVYSLLTNPLLLVALGFLIGGFLAISRFGQLLHTCIRDAADDISGRTH